MLRWDTSRAQEVYLDGNEVSSIGSREVCPTETTDYELRVVGVEEEESYDVTLGVTGSSPATSTPQPTTAPPSPSPTTSPGEAALLATSPTPQATQTTPTVQASGTESATAASPPPTETQAAPSVPPPASSLTPAQIAEVRPTATIVQVAQVEDTAQDPSSPESEESSVPFLPIGYAVFSLVFGGLLGWLIYILRIRGERA
jgi:hypothetical protein